MDKQLWWGIAGIAASIAILGGLAWTIKTPHPMPPAAGGPAATTTPQVSTSTPIIDNKRTDETSYALPEQNTKFKTAESNGEMLNVADQKAGGTVLVTGIRVNRPAWVAIKDVRGWVMGAGRVDRSKDQITIHLLRRTEAGHAYQALLFLDNGNKSFDIYQDAMIVFDGAPVGLTFTAL